MSLLCCACLTISLNLHAPDRATASEIKATIAAANLTTASSARPWSERATLPPRVIEIWMLTADSAVAEVAQTSVSLGLGGTRHYPLSLRRVDDAWKIVD